MEKGGENGDVTSQRGLLSVNRLAVCQISHSNDNVKRHNFTSMNSRQNVSRLSLNPISDRAVVVLKAKRPFYTKTDFYQYPKIISDYNAVRIARRQILHSFDQDEPCKTCKARNMQSRSYNGRDNKSQLVSSST